MTQTKKISVLVLEGRGSEIEEIDAFDEIEEIVESAAFQYWRVEGQEIEEIDGNKEISVLVLEGRGSEIVPV